MRTFEFSDAKSHKFWSIEMIENGFTVKYGKIGTAGQSATKNFPTVAKATQEAEKLIRGKTGKGYVETTAPTTITPKQTLENAIRANPHDTAAHSAYADLLMEENDPRGEFMQVQLALEDESISTAERKKLQTREKALLKAHEKAWAGCLTSPDALETAYDWQAPKGFKPYQFVKGLLTKVEIGGLKYDFAKTMIADPALAFVHDLTIHDFASEDEIETEESNSEEDDSEGSEHPTQKVLVRWRGLRNIRHFLLGGEVEHEYDDYLYGCHVPGEMVYHFVKQMPLLEELHIYAHMREDVANKVASHPMPYLKKIRFYHGYCVPLDRLAKNPTLKNLTHISAHPHALDYDDEPYIRLPGLRAICRSPHMMNLTHLQLRLSDVGDAGVEEIIESGLLDRLKVLDLRHSCITDAGAVRLAECPQIKNLSVLDVSRNAIGGQGIALLEATGANVLTMFQHGEVPNGSAEGYYEYLSQGDYE